MRASKISPEVAQIIGRSHVDGNLLRLPEEQLDRKLYVKVDKFLKELGGKWDRKKRGHVFSHNPEECIKEVLSKGEVSTAKSNSYYPTPEPVSQTMLECFEGFDLPQAPYVLEPSAGKGAIVDAFTRQFPKSTWALVDIFPEHADYLRAKYPSAQVKCEDFLNTSFKSKFDVAVMNPPFQRNSDAKHILHAYDMLGERGVLVSVASESILTRTDRYSQRVQDILYYSKELPECSFAQAGTTVRTCVIVLKRY